MNYSYQFYIWSVWESSNWLMVEDNEKESGYFVEPFLYFLHRLQYIYDDIPIDTGECRYRFKKDPNHFIYQWDDLFGIAVEYRCSVNTAKKRLEKLLEQVNEKLPTASKEGLNGIDRWTSNGVGATISSNTPDQQKIIDQINCELDKK